MMDLGMIRELNAKATRKAKRTRKLPAVPTPEQRKVLATGDLEAPGWSIPALGDYVPDGWTLITSHFVDMSGFGREDEAALTQSTFAKLIAAAPENHGFASGEYGQFQIYVGEYRRG